MNKLCYDGNMLTNINDGSTTLQIFQERHDFYFSLFFSVDLTSFNIKPLHVPNTPSMVKNLAEMLFHSECFMINPSPKINGKH